MSNNIVKLSDTTRAIMKNFAGISQSFLLETNKELRVSDADTGTCFARADIEEQFPMEFAIADINQLLNILSLSSMKDCSIEFVPDNEATNEPRHMVIKGGKTSVRFFSSSAVTVDLPNKEEGEEPQINDADVVFEAEIPGQVWVDFVRACKTLGLSHCSFLVQDKKSYLVGSDPTIDNSDDYVVDLGETEREDVTVPVLIKACKFIESESYTIKAQRLFINANTKGNAVSYFISAEQL